MAGRVVTAPATSARGPRPSTGPVTRLALTMLVAVLALPVVVAGTARAQPAPGWVSQQSGTTARLSAVSFTDARHGHVVGAAGTILATDDGGAHWVRQLACVRSTPCTLSSKDLVTADLTAVSFTEGGAGYAVGAGGAILATVDGGQTWAVQLACATSDPCLGSSGDRVTADLAGVSFLDADQGYAVGAAGTFLATVDGGRRWVVQTCTALDPQLRICTQPQRLDITGVSFVGGADAYAVGTADNGRMLLLRNTGDGWAYTGLGIKPQLIPLDVPLASTSFSPSYGGGGGQASTHGHAVGRAGTILNTVSGGLTWGAQESGVAADLTGVSFSDDFNGRVVGTGGTALTTTDGGQSWLAQPSGTTVDLTGVSTPDANDAYAVGDGGTILAAHHPPPAGLAVVASAPADGPVSGGTEVTVTGTGFTDATYVLFGHVRAESMLAQSDTRLTATSPEHLPGDVDVVVGTATGASDINPAARFTFKPPVAGTWQRVADCPSLCDGPAVRLHDGRVLTVGAGEDHPSRADALIFDPAGGRWRRTAPMPAGRTDPLVTVLQDGRVLVTGDVYDKAHMLTADLYDPRSGTWHPTGSVISWGPGDPLFLGTATLLGTGKVLLTTDSEKTQLFDPATGTWSAGPSMAVPHVGSPAILLPDGEVLVEGGLPISTGPRPATLAGELYDPVANTWRTTGPLGVPHERHNAVSLGDGRVLVIGGTNPGFSYTEVFDPAVDTWRPAAPTNTERRLHVSVDLLPDGKVLAVGGVSYESPTTSTELYDPATDTWSVATPLPLGHLDEHRTIVLSRPGCGSLCGKLLLFGSGNTKATFVYTPPVDPADTSSGSSGGPPALLLGVIGLLVGASAGILLAGWLAARRRRGGAGDRPADRVADRSADRSPETTEAPC